MGMDLLGNHGQEWFNMSAWGWCLQRALEFGWEPEGTVAPTHWSGECDGKDYFCNEWQTVTDRDARALGEALVRAIATLSARVDVQKTSTEELNTSLFVKEEPVDAEIACLRRLADYALKGGFVIA
jgi:hypothetical protein